MIIHVFNTELGEHEKVDVSKLNPEIHMHRNTLTPFTQEDLEGFGVEKPKAKKGKVAEEVTE